MSFITVRNNFLAKEGRLKVMPNERNVDQQLDKRSYIICWSCKEVKLTVLRQNTGPQTAQKVAKTVKVGVPLLRLAAWRNKGTDIQSRRMSYQSER